MRRPVIVLITLQPISCHEISIKLPSLERLCWVEVWNYLTTFIAHLIINCGWTVTIMRENSFLLRNSTEYICGFSCFCLIGSLLRERFFPLFFLSWSLTSLLFTILFLCLFESIHENRSFILSLVHHGVPFVPKMDIKRQIFSTHHISLPHLLSVSAGRLLSKEANVYLFLSSHFANNFKLNFTGLERTFKEFSLIFNYLIL